MAYLKIVALSLLLSFLIMLHQFLIWGVWFDINDIHHETFALMFLAFAIGVYVGKHAK